MKTNTDRLAWLGHSGFRLSGGRLVYFDPWEAGGPIADIILITHDHFDHCDPPTVRALSGPKTQIVTEPAAAAKLKAEGFTHIKVMAPGDEIEIDGVNIQAVPAYNLNKDFHPRAQNYLGFIVTLDGLSVYHAGDTDCIPEMSEIKAQVALLPVSGTYVMTAEEAVQAALAISPAVAIPMHFNKIVGDDAMARTFAEALKDRLPVEIKPCVP
ncbi:MAG: MBL fold metallo-hydrolase [Candidatus Adiutrix sp.]|jgi:L-ascorbate metabolism protein UlaG (beta-lactamase superfamily)|nr:MBL fold metallo-hydrolase [Candidatus Adiutrix sp.]